ncbi:alpha/beta hydrolase [Pleionea sp. CnH1-48]|uniref:alpha/beta hydrolase n=1 Tax=Pleionea sp. CnH1-48 TaxID=2954494 RepID=UPI0020973A4D|nr:alpha/beta hydrolase-fold protein [Pleionea sp. CnH1-48]MCO7224958.1 alpha/beta hydrolase-fold protein [Pleionea sp. CnH1-48]
MPFKTPYTKLFSFLLIIISFPSLSQSPPPNGQAITLGSTYPINSKALKQERKINIYLPPGYSEGSKKYPVLYLLDGGLHEDFFHIMGIASLAADYRKIRPFILVGIEGINRYYDLTTKSIVPEDIKSIPKNGGAIKFRQFLIEEVQPFVNAHWRVSDERILMGESLAGHFVLDTFIETPNAFSGYISVSPSMWWNNQALAKSAQNKLDPHKLLRSAQLFITIGNEGGDMRKALDHFVGALKKHAPSNLVWQFSPMEQESHATIFHPAALQGVRTLLKTEEKASQ